MSAANSPPHQTGMFLNRIPYLKMGNGPNNLVIIRETSELFLSVGSAPEGQYKIFKRVIPPKYTLYILGYDKNLSDSNTEETIVDDYAKILKDEIGPSVLMGMSYGGLNAITLAGKYPDLVKKLILLVSAHKASEQGLILAKEWMRMVRAGELFKLNMSFADLFGKWIFKILSKIMTKKNLPKKTIRLIT